MAMTPNLKQKAQNIVDEFGGDKAFLPYVKLAVRIAEFNKEMVKELGLSDERVSQLVVSSALTYLKMLKTGQEETQYELNLEISKLIDATVNDVARGAQ